jgi:hypothetical protein
MSDLFKDYRVFPRMFGILFGFLMWEVAYWFMSLDVPSVEQAGFASTMVATSAAYFKFYVESGK